MQLVSHATFITVCPIRFLKTWLRIITCMQSMSYWGVFAVGFVTRPIGAVSTPFSGRLRVRLGLPLRSLTIFNEAHVVLLIMNAL